jgi:hypothetical protein
MATDLRRKKSLSPENLDAFVQYVIQCYHDDVADRQDWSDARLQRYAKYRGWREPKDYPWPNASNQHVPLLMTNSQRTQDTLHNAVIGNRPCVSAIAVNPADQEKGKVIDPLLDFQLFTEQTGEEKIGELIESYVNDGKFVAFIPWIVEKRDVVEVLGIPTPPPGVPLAPYFTQEIKKKFPDAYITQTDTDGYEWKAISTDEKYQEQTATIEFYYNEDDACIMQIERPHVVYEGPCVIPKSLEDVIVPSRATNLQPPGPSNPGGADHVILVDYPSIDEITRLEAKGYYDLLDDEKLEQIEETAEGEAGTQRATTSEDPEQHKIQKDALAGQTYGNAKTARKVFTRLTFFGRYDVDDDDREEEIVARILLEPKAACRIRLLQEEYPTPTPRRPFAEGSMIPVQGEWYAIGMLELTEHLHDFMKTILDQMVDKHTMTNTPTGFYRSGSGVRPEVIRWEPGALYPVSNPQNDVVFPQLPMADQSVAMNILALAQQWAEKQTMQGQLQFGGVPQGKASALRTSSNMMSVLQQGDARPERILRRFFRGLAEIYQQMHELNQAFLPAKKQYRVTGVTPEGSDPYRQIQDPTEIRGPFQFDFKANALNTNKVIQSQVLTQLSAMLINGMTLQTGLMNVEKIYNLLKDVVMSMGQDPNKYLVAPPQANLPKLTAEDAMGQMARGELPQGLPAEGAQAHLQALLSAQRDPRLMQLFQTDPAFGVIFHTYLQQVQVQLQQEQQQAMAAQQFAQAMGGGGTGQGGPEGQIDLMANQMAQQGPGQVNDESLPGAKNQML